MAERELFPLMMFAPRPNNTNVQTEKPETPPQGPLLRQAASRDFRPVRPRSEPAPTPRKAKESESPEGEEIPKASSVTSDVNSSPSDSPAITSENADSPVPTHAVKESDNFNEVLVELEVAKVGTTGETEPPVETSSSVTPGDDQTYSSPLLPATNLQL